FCFFTHAPTPPLHPLSLHDALPISLRAPGSNALCFASQSFLDEVAIAAGTDLPKLMLSLLGERREIAAPDNRSPSFDTGRARDVDRKSTRLNSSHLGISYAVFCLKK